MDAVTIFEEFVLNLNTMNSNFDVNIFLPELVLNGVITSEERMVIEKRMTPVHRSVELCLRSLPGKSEDQQRSFVKVLRRNGYSSLAQYLERKLNKLYSKSSQQKLQRQTPLTSIGGPHSCVDSNKYLLSSDSHFKESGVLLARSCSYDQLKDDYYNRSSTPDFQEWVSQR